MRPIPIERLRQIAIPLINYSETAYCCWNPVKERLEFWHKHSPIGSVPHWELFQAWPAVRWSETFLVNLRLFEDYLKCDLSWDINANPAPNNSNYAVANELGGGVVILTDGVSAGADDWAAVHWGGNFPTDVDHSPHLGITVALPTASSLRRMMGLVGATNKPGDGVAFPELLTFPYDGIYVNCDTTVSPCTCLDVVAGGVLRDRHTITTVPTTAHHHMHLIVNDAGTRVAMLRDGAAECTLDCSALSGIQLQPYVMMMTKISAVRSIHLHDFTLLMDEV